VLTVAAASAQPLRGAALLTVYAAGMTAPLFGLAAAWDRLGVDQRRWLRGTGVRVGTLALVHPLGDLGADLHRPGRGLPALPGHRRAGRAAGPPSLAGWDNRLQDAVTAIQAHVPDLALLAAAAAVVVAVTAWRLRRTRHAASTAPPQPAGEPTAVEPAMDDPARERAS